MNKFTNIALLVAAAVIAVSVERLVLVRPVASPEPASPSRGLEGKVISVEPESSGGRLPASRTARVKLVSGETVDAIVGGCVIYPGQMTRLERRGQGSSTVYVVSENGRNDS